MEPCNNQYINQRNDYLYIYACRRPVCCCCYNGYCNHQPDYTNLYTSRAALPELNCSITTSKIYQWNQWNLESCYNQYINCRNNHLYIYACCWSVCCCCYDGYCDHQS